MPRAPFQVLVFPFRCLEDNLIEYAVFERADSGAWQGISGGGEDDETPVQAAKREGWEEGGIPDDYDYVRLDTVNSIPVSNFAESGQWVAERYVIPEYAFGVDVDDGDLEISEEHTRFVWLGYEEAYALVEYESNRTALWELDCRIRKKDLPIV